jgi:hypothetical protein
MQVRDQAPCPKRLFHAAGNSRRLKASSTHRMGMKTDAGLLGSALPRNSCATNICGSRARRIAVLQALSWSVKSI